MNICKNNFDVFGTYLITVLISPSEYSQLFKFHLISKYYPEKYIFVYVLDFGADHIAYLKALSKYYDLPHL